MFASAYFIYFQLKETKLHIKSEYNDIENPPLNKDLPYSNLDFHNFFFYNDNTLNSLGIQEKIFLFDINFYPYLNYISTELIKDTRIVYFQWEFYYHILQTGRPVCYRAALKKITTPYNSKETIYNFELLNSSYAGVAFTEHITHISATFTLIAKRLAEAHLIRAMLKSLIPFKEVTLFEYSKQVTVEGKIVGYNVINGKLRYIYILEQSTLPEAILEHCES